MKESYIYFIETIDYDFIKIGISTNVSQRLKSLQSSCPLELRMLRYIKGGPKDEQYLHNRFAKYIVRGEWYCKSKDLMDFIDGEKYTPFEPDSWDEEAPWDEEVRLDYERKQNI